MKLRYIYLLLLTILCVGYIFPTITPWGPHDDTPGSKKWYELKAGHFIIFYQERDEALAKRVVVLAESFYEDYADIFRYPLEDVYIRIEHSVHLDGSYLIAPPLISLYTGSIMTNAKGYEDMYMLLAHEFVHYLHLQYPKGLGGVLAKIIGPIGRLAATVPTPGYLTEGLAVSIESDMSAGGRRNTPLYAMPLRAKVLLSKQDEYLKSTLTFLDDNMAHMSRIYNYGAYFMTYIKERYGYQMILDIWQYFSKFPFNLSMRSKKFLGKTMYELHDEMLIWLEEKNQQFSGFSRGREIDDKENDRAIRVALANTDQGVFMYTLGGDVTLKFDLLDREKNIFQKIMNRKRPGTADFFPMQSGDSTPDGSLIVYDREYFIGGNSTELVLEDSVDLWLYNTNKNTHKRITRGQNLTRAVLSPDSKYVYTTQIIHAGLQSRLIGINIQGTEYKKGYEILYESPQSHITYKDVSPDGKKIVFVERSYITGISLKVLDLDTREVHTLIQRDWGLWIGIPHFIDTERILVVADIEHPTEMTNAYVVDLTDTTWRRIARDKVGIYSAVMTDNGELWYTSHNGTAFSTYVYQSHELENTLINLDEFTVGQFQDNNLQRHLNAQTIENSVEDSNESETPPTMESRIEVLEYTKKRILTAIPSRLRYAVPFGRLDTGNDVTWVTFGYLLSFEGKTQDSVLDMELFVQSHTWQPVYSIMYGVKLNQLLALEFNSTRNHIQDGESFVLGYTHRAQLNIGGIRKYTVSGGRNAPTIGTTFSHYNTSDTPINITESHDDSLEHGMNIEFDVIYPLVWRSLTPTIAGNHFAVGVSPGLKYTPPLFSVTTHQVQGIIDAYWTIPIGSIQAIKLSTYNSLANVSGYQSPTERYSRVTTLNILSFRSLGGIQTPLQSSFALDIILPFGPFDKGFYVLHPYKFSIDAFVEQTIGYDIFTSEFEMNNYLTTGIEVSLTVGIFNAVPLNLRVGSAYKIPYSSANIFDYQVYVAVGSDIHNVSGAHPQYY